MTMNSDYMKVPKTVKGKVRSTCNIGLHPHNIPKMKLGPSCEAGDGLINFG